MKSRHVLWSALTCVVVFAAAVRAAGPPTIVDVAKAGNVEAVRTFLKQPKAANVATKDGTTALHWATDLDNLAMAQALVRAGANVKVTNRYGVTPMYSAAVNGNAAMIELLLNAGADPNVALPEGETPLMTAARTGKATAVRLLLARGATVNAVEKWKQQTALMWAAHEGNAEVAKILIEAGANVNARSMFGWTPLLFAARQGQVATIEALVAGG
ncbi:MAG: ankyrin repeat domain-containing protein, partial [Vicinamibacterales bacterium]